MVPRKQFGALFRCNFAVDVGMEEWCLITSSTHIFPSHGFPWCPDRKGLKSEQDAWMLLPLFCLMQQHPFLLCLTQSSDCQDLWNMVKGFLELSNIWTIWTLHLINNRSIKPGDWNNVIGLCVSKCKQTLHLMHRRSKGMGWVCLFVSSYSYPHQLLQSSSYSSQV